jgi:tetratricopeptide (TPR) repeat protein
MTAENGKANHPEAKQPIVPSSCLVALATLSLYGLTLNHWVTFGSLPFASQFMGWNWHPGPLPWRPSPHYHPLFLILTFPLRLLPADWRLIGLNALSAVCAALTLAILARSVRILRHDRTHDQRRRRRGRHALLPGRAAFLPALFAVLLLAAQESFWRNAVSWTGEMMDALVFAFLIFCLLKYRISRRQGWLSLFAFLYGVGVANDWALIGFFPCFLFALIWIKRKRFFRWKFVLPMTSWGVLGLLLYGLTPLLGAAAHDASFWQLLRQNLAGQHIALITTPRYYAVIAAIPTLIPLLFAAVKWPSSKAERYSGARNFPRLLFRLLHVAFLAVGVLVFFNVKLNPFLPVMRAGARPGAPAFLSFYYLAALSVGYFSGYVLLVFGRNAVPRGRRAAEIPPARAFNRVAAGFLSVAAIGLPALLFCRNFPLIRDSNCSALAQFGEEMARALPPKSAIVLADDPDRLYLTLGASQKLRLQGSYTFVESRSLTHPEYLRCLANRFPSFHREITHPDRLAGEIEDWKIGDLLARLARRGEPLYYLQPSFGAYFERVCMSPRRFGGDLHPCPTNFLATLALTPAEIAANQAWWLALGKQSLASLPELANKSPDARRVANIYSQLLDNWGVELQKTAAARNLPLLDDAGAQFAEALRLNPDNVIARANQQFNARLRGVPSPAPPISSSAVAAYFHNRWDIALNFYGPADTPDLDLQIGRYFARRGAGLQAAHLFQRCIRLAPNDPAGKQSLAEILIVELLNAAETHARNIRQPSSSAPADSARAEIRTIHNDLARADAWLAGEHEKNPNDHLFTGFMAECYRVMGDIVLREGRGNPAAEKSAEQDAAAWFKKAWTAFDEQWRCLNAIGASSLEISNACLRKAEVQMKLKDCQATNATP